MKNNIRNQITSATYYSSIQKVRRKWLITSSEVYPCPAFPKPSRIDLPWWPSSRPLAPTTNCPVRTWPSSTLETELMASFVTVCLRRKKRQKRSNWHNLWRKWQSPISLTAGVPGNVPVFMLIGIKEEGPLIGFGVVVDDPPSAVLLILAMAPCTHACIWEFPLVVVAPLWLPILCRSTSVSELVSVKKEVNDQ